MREVKVREFQRLVSQGWPRSLSARSTGRPQASRGGITATMAQANITEPEQTRWRRKPLRIDFAPATILAAVGIVAGIWLLERLWPVLLMIVVALVLAGTLNPLVEACERQGLRRSWALGLIFVAFVGVTGVLGAATVPPLVEQLAGAVSNAPATQGRLADELARHRITAGLADTIRHSRPGDQLAASAAHYTLKYSTKIVELIGYAVTAVFLGFYVLADRDRARGAAYAVVPRKYHLRLARILLNLETIVGGYMRGQIITSICAAAFTGVMLAICKVPNALALAVFAGVADVVPFVGALLAVTPCVLMATSRGPTATITVLVALVAYQEFESRVIIPRVYGKVLRLPPAVVIISLVAGGRLLGIVGALLALPIAAGLRMVFEEMRVELPGDASDDTALRIRDEIAERAYRERTAGAAPEEAAAVAVQMADEIRHEDAPTDEDAATVPVTGGLSGGEPSRS